MQLVTVGPKYQIVIPKAIRRDIKGLKPGSKLLVSKEDEDTLTIKIDPEGWVNQTYGMMAQAWKDRDPIAERETINNDWEERLKEQAKIWNYGEVKNVKDK